MFPRSMSSYVSSLPLFLHQGNFCLWVHYTIFTSWMSSVWPGNITKYTGTRKCMLLCSQTFLLFPLKNKFMILTVKTPKALTEREKREQRQNPKKDKLLKPSGYKNYGWRHVKGKRKCWVLICNREEIFSEYNNSWLFLHWNILSTSLFILFYHVIQITYISNFHFTCHTSSFDPSWNYLFLNINIHGISLSRQFFIFGVCHYSRARGPKRMESINETE